MRGRATAKGVTVVALVIGFVACHSGSPSSSDFQSCGDPKIRPVARLTVERSQPLDARVNANENHVRSVADARAVFAQARPSNGPVVTTPPPDGGSEHDVIDAFVAATDFTKEELVFFSDQFTGSSDGFLGALSRSGTTVLVSAASCGGGGGAAQPQIEWVAVYRIPLGNDVRRMACGECGPPPPCCPP